MKNQPMLFILISIRELIIKLRKKKKTPTHIFIIKAVRAKKTPVAGMMTKKIYHTNMGDPDLSWYLGLDPDIKKEDCDPTDNTSSNVEVCLFVNTRHHVAGGS